MAYLILVRHGQTEWNALGRFSGSTDIPLSEVGKLQAKTAAASLRHISLQQAYSSELVRARETLRLILDELPSSPRVTVHPALNERSYGIYEGKSKKEVADAFGPKTMHQLKRGWDFPTPEGETLKQVYARVVPFYQTHILPDLKAGKNVIVSSHINTLRALTKHLENLSDTAIESVELGNAEVVSYEINQNGAVAAKTILSGGELSADSSPS